MNCKQCGTEFEGKFCPNCGTQVVAEASISQSTEKVTVKKQRAKKPFYKKWWFFALILIVIIAVVGCIAGGNKSEKIEWSKMKLAEILPESESNKGKIYENTDEELWIELYKTSEDQFNDYISLCKAKGFTVDASTTSISYEAYNNEGYSLNLSWYNDQMTIWLVSPMEFTTIQWPSSTVGLLLPTPESTVGKFSFENDDSFFVYIGNTTKADFGEYVIACADKDFNIDFNKGDTYYYADNSEGYHVSVMYEGNNVMSIRIDSPDDSENATSTEPNDSSTTQSEIDSTPDIEVTESQTSNVTFNEIYYAYKENELRADETYKNNRYRITAEINGISTGGLFNFTGGATLTMEIRVDNTIVYFYAEFEKDQESALKSLNVGDTITFEGECLSAGTWVECTIVE